jgi:hypothetical protein
LEQEKDWAAVLSKSSKKATAKAKPQKHVCFDKNLVHHSSLDKTTPNIPMFFRIFALDLFHAQLILLPSLFCLATPRF